MTLLRCLPNEGLGADAAFVKSVLAASVWKVVCMVKRTAVVPESATRVHTPTHNTC
jgi:hypothetical protein